MSTNPKSISELIAKWPTIAEFASEVGCGYEAARKMSARGRVGPRHWSSVVAASERKGIEGVTFDWLAGQYGPAADTLPSPIETESAA
jgi:hypothetical protein